MGYNAKDMDREAKVTTSRDGTLIAYETYCRPGERPQLVFVHGLGGDLDAWQFVREPLLQTGYSAVALDLRGHGYSGHPTYWSAYKLSRFNDDIAAVLAAERLERPVLVGHSGGAIVALNYALAHQEQLGGLVLLAGSYGPPGYMRNWLLRLVSQALLSVGALVSYRTKQAWRSPYPAGKHHKEFEWYGLGRTLYHNSLRSYLLTTKALLTLSVWHKLPTVTVPTLLVAGEKDGIYPLSIARTMHERIKTARLVTIPDANHVVILNNPQEVVAALQEFLPAVVPQSARAHVGSFHTDPTHFGQ